MLSPTRLAAIATRRPGRVLAAWGVAVLVSLGLIGALLGGALTSEQRLTNHPQSGQAQAPVHARLPKQDRIDEVIVVRSERHRVTDPAFAARVRALTAAVQAAGAVVHAPPDPIASADGHATLLPLELAEPKQETIEHVVAAVERAGGDNGFATHITGGFTLDRDFTRLSESDLQSGEMQFGLPAPLIRLLLVIGTVAA